MSLDAIKWSVSVGGVSFLILCALGYLIYKKGLPLIESRIKQQDEVIAKYNKALSDQNEANVKTLKEQAAVTIDALKEQLIFSQANESKKTQAFLASLSERDKIQNQMHTQLVKMNQILTSNKGTATRSRKKQG